MNRDIVTALKAWKTSTSRRPLLLRGARQVGKSFVIRQFGATNFRNLVEVNFEAQPKLQAIFQDLDPDTIVRNLSLATGQEILVGETLLFLDEIQECPEAVLALRYFFEKIPQLHVIAAGSLLEFLLQSSKISIPVGRIQYAYLFPLSFYEFLEASGHVKLREFLHTVTPTSAPSVAIHDTLMELVKQYFVVGGMPEVINVFLEAKQKVEFQNIQLSLLQTFRDDFGKYASIAKHKYLRRVFETAPTLLRQQVKYSRIDRDIGARELKDALFLLESAGVVSRVCAASAHGLPFAASARQEKFKLLFLDLGLAQRSLGLDAQIAISRDLLTINAGGICEQFVGQELRAMMSPYAEDKLYYWAREERNSSAEIDYLTEVDGQIVALEVKAGATGRLKSLRRVMEDTKAKLGVRVAQLPLSLHDGILSVPLYMVPEIPRLVRGHL
jgi:predicted AAA+ superfamily ATPase